MKNKPNQKSKQLWSEHSDQMSLNYLTVGFQRIAFMHLQKPEHLLIIMHCLSTQLCSSLFHLRTRVDQYHNAYGSLNTAGVYKMLLITFIILWFTDLARSKNQGKIYDSSYLCYMQTLVSLQQNADKFTKHGEFPSFHLQPGH